jgi:hypothetical protein
MSVTKRDPLKARDWKKYVPDKAWNRSAFMRFIVFAGAAFTINILWASWDYVLKHAEDVLQDGLIFSSFHLHPRDCGVADPARNSWVALVSDNRAVIATPAMHGYTFETVKCEMQSERDLAHTRLDRLKEDNYQ